MFTLSYTSLAAKPFTNAELAGLLNSAQNFNAAADITGALLYRNTRFIQVLEGPEKAVRDLFARIFADPRHVIDRSTSAHRETRRFSRWAMSYEQLDDSVQFSLDPSATPSRAREEHGAEDQYAVSEQHLVSEQHPVSEQHSEAAFDRLYQQWFATPIPAQIQFALTPELAKTEAAMPEQTPAIFNSLTGATGAAASAALTSPAKAHISSSGVVSAVFDIIMYEIHTGTLLPGDRVNDQALAKKLGVSRTPVREALQRLREIGVVEVAANRFTRISVVEPADVEKILVVLAALYALVLDELIGALNDTVIDSLREAGATLNRTVATGSPVCVASATVDFFMTLANETSNPSLHKQIFSLAHVIKLASSELDSRIGFTVIVNAADTLVRAVETADLALARSAMAMLQVTNRSRVISAVGLSPMLSH